MPTNKFNMTQELNVDDLVKTIPVICSWCNKIYHMKQWQVEKGKQTGASHGMCPECELKQLEELKRLNDEKNSDGSSIDEFPSSAKSKVLKKTKEFNIDQMSKTIPIVCSWCNKIYHLKEWQVEKGRRTGVSHGMCPECEQKQKEELRKLQNSK
ncbi:MAG: hypothetical protein GXP32_01495 [Kiritimatiellaeota bacterium]|nr:hypothetical protein [Kiritimatiellota bacterium]